jgi:hypothetical protein
LRTDMERGKLVSKDGWVICPDCHSMRLLRLPPNGKVQGFVYCRHCKCEKYLDIDLSLSH